MDPVKGSMFWGGSSSLMQYCGGTLSQQQVNEAMFGKFLSLETPSNLLNNTHKLQAAAAAGGVQGGKAFEHLCA
jgi:hypothetical protein